MSQSLEREIYMTTTLKVNNKIFNSIVKAAKFIGCPAYRISNTLYAKKNEINGFTIEKIEKKATRKRRPFVSKRSVQVKCLDDNKIFNSIAQAAKSINVNQWTFGLKMEKAGKFIDKDGKTYVRLTPMQSKDLSIYPEQSPKLEREIIRHSNRRTSETIKTVPEISNTPVKTKEVSEIQMLCTVGQKLADNNHYAEASMIYTILDKLTNK